MKIRTKILIAFLMVSLSGISFLGYFTYRLTKDYLLEGRGEQLKAVAATKKQQINYFVSSWKNKIEILHSREGLKEEIESFLENPSSAQTLKIKDTFLPILEGDRQIQQVSLFDLTGKKLITIGNEILERPPLSRFPSPDPQATAIRNIWMDTATYQLFFLWTSPLKYDGKLIGSIEVIVHGKEFQNIVHNFQGLKNSGETLVVCREENGDARFLTPLRFHPNPGLKLTVPSTHKNDPVIQSLNNNENFFSHEEIVDYRQVPILSATSYLPELDWGLVVKIDREEALLSELFLFRTMVGLCLGISILVILASTLFSRAITRPMTALSETAKKIIEGNLSERATVNSKDEIGYLAKTLNQMLTSLEEKTLAFMTSEKQHRAILDNTVDGLITIDAKGTIESFNKACETIFGYRAEEVIGKNVSLLMPQPYHSEHDQYLSNYHKTGEKKVIGLGREVQGKRKNNTIFPLDLSVAEVQIGEKKLYSGIVRDITERKEAESKLKKTLEDLHTSTLNLEINDQKIRAILDNTVDGLITIDAKGTVESFNKACETIFGYRADEVVGKNVSLLMPEPYHSEHDEYLSNYHKTGEKKVIGLGREVQGKRKDNTIFPLDLSVAEVQVSGKKLYSGIVRDITERKTAESKLKKTLEDLKISNEELEKFAYIASHDLKSPLRGIDNLAKWLEEDLGRELTDTNAERMKKLRGRVLRMEHLLDDLLEYSRAGRNLAKTEIIRADRLIEEIKNLINIPRNFTVEIDSSLQKITVPRMPLEQVFQNLIGNAIKHHTREDGKVVISVKENNEEYLFSVTDDGPGIPEKFHNKIFEMFQTLKPRDEVEGSGMGLALVKKIIHRFGGKITVDSHEDKGTTFTFSWTKQFSVFNNTNQHEKV